jgi:hypothetical protein
VVLDVEMLDREVVRGPEDVQVRAGRVPQPGDHLHQPLAPRPCVQLGVEALVELEVGLRGRPRAHLLEQRLERRRPFGLEPLGGLADRELLERDPDLVVLAQVVDRRQEHHRAALRMQGDEALPLQRGERLADRRRADPESPRDLHLAQALARRELAGHDLLSQSGGDGTGDRPGAVEARLERGAHLPSMPEVAVTIPRPRRRPTPRARACAAGRPR